VGRNTDMYVENMRIYREVMNEVLCKSR